MIFAFILATLAFTGVVRPWHILLLAFGLGLANAFDSPARQAFVSELVDREDMTNAIALNATMFNSATAVGPAVAGVIYAILGPAWCFTINGVSFIAVIAALASMHLQPQAPSPQQHSTVAALKEGISYIMHEPDCPRTYRARSDGKSFRYVVGDTVTCLVCENFAWKCGNKWNPLFSAGFRVAHWSVIYCINGANILSRQVHHRRVTSISCFYRNLRSGSLASVFTSAPGSSWFCNDIRYESLQCINPIAGAR